MAKFNIAMLSQQEASDDEVGTSNLEVMGQQAEDAISQAKEHQVEIEQAQQVIDDTEEVIRGVEEEKVALEKAQLRGGADPMAMEAFQRAVKRFERRTGVKYPNTGLGLEAFESKTTRLQSTRVALEGVKEFVEKIIKMLMDAIAYVMEKIKAFFEKLILGTERLAARARQIMAAAKQLRGEAAAKAGGIAIASVLIYARMNDKVVEGANFVKEYARQMAPDFPSRKAVTDGISHALKNNIFTDLINKAKTPNSEAEIAKEIAKVQPIPGSKADEPGMVTAPEKRTLGDFVSTVTSFSPSATWDQVSSGFQSIKNRFVRAEDAKEEVATSVEALSAEEVIELCKAATENMRNYEKVRSEQKTVSERLKKIATDAREMASGVAEGASDQMRVVIGYIRAWINSFSQSMVSFFSYDVNLTKAALDYAAASVNAIKGTFKSK